jgi:hypothetical protein
MASKTTAEDVLVYIPNLIGYMRVILTLTSIVLMICFPSAWVVAIICYLASFVGDLFDGMAARKFDQCSSFGGLIDMVTDRCSTTGLLCVLSQEFSDQPSLVLVRRRSYYLLLNIIIRVKNVVLTFAVFTWFILLQVIYDAHNTRHLQSLVSNVFNDGTATTSQISWWE